MKDIFSKIFTGVPSVEEIVQKYPPRGLDSGKKVTRFGPSPTGFMHIGGLYAALISARIAKQSEGIFYLRIEDTDKKREQDDAINIILQSLYAYDVIPNEGIDLQGIEYGPYSPYKQSERKLIYQAYIRQLLEQGKAYLCFQTAEELDKIRAEQELAGVRTGYYGPWAKSRMLSPDVVLDKFNSGMPFVVRFKSPGNYEKKMIIKDLLKGSRDLPENDLDVVIMKADGLPTYHFAHVIDDHLMGTTHVIRGDEWFSSVPLHIQLFQAMGWKPTKYVHIAPIQKMENNSRRKLSKRKDPEANINYYIEQGYPKNSVIEYLLNLANANFEDWRRKHPDLSNIEFNLELNKLNSSGALFDLVKLESISKDIIGKMSASEVFAFSFAWAKQYDIKLYHIMEQNPDYMKNILSIERENVVRIRKDIAKWSDIKTEFRYFFNEKFSYSRDELIAKLTEFEPAILNNIVADFINVYNINDDKKTWFEKILNIATKYGYAKNAKEFKADPAKFKGDVSSVVKIFRLLLTGREQTPDLHAIMQVMGRDMVLQRLLG